MRQELLGLSIVIVAVGVLGAIGCVACSETATVWQSKVKNLIFNPESSGIEVVDSTRSSWPSTSAGYKVNQTTVYKETVLDRQGGRYGHSNDGRRHFTSVRTGKIQR